MKTPLGFILSSIIKWIRVLQMTIIKSLRNSKLSLFLVRYSFDSVTHQINSQNLRVFIVSLHVCISNYDTLLWLNMFIILDIEYSFEVINARKTKLCFYIFYFPWYRLFKCVKLNSNAQNISWIRFAIISMLQLLSI